MCSSDLDISIISNIVEGSTPTDRIGEFALSGQGGTGVAGSFSQSLSQMLAGAVAASVQAEGRVFNNPCLFCPGSVYSFP